MPPVERKRTRSLPQSFHYAFEGLYYVFKTQPNMRIQTVVAALVLLAAWGFEVSRADMLHLMLCMVLVLLAEAMNTAVEGVINLHADKYSEKARIAKDVAAGCVLIAAVYSFLVGVWIFANNENFVALFQVPPRLPPRPHLGPLQIVLVGMLLLAVVIAWVKRATGSRAFLTGGVVSGHTALGFLIATSIAFISRSMPITALAVAMALLLAQSRLQSDIHSVIEVLVGAALGVALAFIIFAWPLPA
jgi:diacylglycerol kinase (ATP)